ncbi:hypothetical protein AYO40_03305 [Planctomycetaceae bacterium SCGC AG-212-D15]|nr:hypothetical protein AYO40_03305 [Planctomycetaceae bacterium SCGC AG-212-D15]
MRVPPPIFLDPVDCSLIATQAILGGLHRIAMVDASSTLRAPIFLDPVDCSLIATQAILGGLHRIAMGTADESADEVS